MIRSIIVNNVKLVLEDEVVAGSLEMRDGVIASFSETRSQQPAALDGKAHFCCRAWLNCIPIILTSFLRRVRKLTGQPTPQ